MGAMIVRHSVRELRGVEARLRRPRGGTDGRGPNQRPRLPLREGLERHREFLFDMADRRRAEEFGRSDDLREAMQRTGVVGQPDFAE